MRCPLPREKKKIRDIEQLVQNCHEAKCWYIRDSDSDRLPSGCVLLVAGLIATKKGG